MRLLIHFQNPLLVQPRLTRSLSLFFPIKSNNSKIDLLIKIFVPFFDFQLKISLKIFYLDLGLLS